jgi:two-component system nitrogen regulation sensor histidine kinase GlnL
MWSLFKLAAIVALVVNTAMGAIGYAVNPYRRVNRAFFLTTLALSFWLVCLVHGADTSSRQEATFWIRYATVASSFIIAGFDFLRIAIVGKRRNRRSEFMQALPWLIMLAALAPVLHLPAFIRDVTFSETGFPTPLYGWPQKAYVAYFLAGLCLLTWRFARDLRVVRGVQRAELEYTVLAFAVCAGAGITFGHLIPLASGSTSSVQLMPLAVIFLDVIIVYGVATRRIMSVGEVMRRVAAYGLLAIYLVALYLLVLNLAAFLMGGRVEAAERLAPILAALTVAFSATPARGALTRFAAHLFPVDSLDVPTAMRKAQQAIAHIGPMDDLMRRFAEVVCDTVRTDRALLLVRDRDSYRQLYPRVEDGEGLRIASDHNLASLLRHEAEPLSHMALTRMRPTPARRDAAAFMEARGLQLGLGIRVKDSLEVILLLGDRTSSRLYGPHEQDALQLICNQFGVAYDNAKLYTELQDGKIYNEILVDSMVSGVIAANADGVVTVLNREAQRITDVAADMDLGLAIDELPHPMAQALRATLSDGQDVIDHEMVLTGPDERETPIRLSCAVFRGHSGALLGVLGVFSDLTIFKKLEDQVRRSDRLSSIGTLAAGMAHEIKNPLVSINTFTQLLPERYNDEDFRNTFSRLIGKEVKRIDSIVNRLLKFSRPAKPLLRRISLEDVLEDTVKLVEEQVHTKSIELVRDFQAGSSEIDGDADLLSQALLNFLLNAIESMEQGGVLTVATASVHARWLSRNDPRARARLRLSISDTGCGIEGDDIAKVFDPFFTTKTSGTGLGLSVSHGIILEHGATIEVDSHPDMGTTFHIHFPAVLRKEQAA